MDSIVCRSKRRYERVEYRRALPIDMEQRTELVQNTIDTVYPKYYSKEAVDFFLFPLLQRKNF